MVAKPTDQQQWHMSAIQQGSRKEEISNIINNEQSCGAKANSIFMQKTLTMKTKGRKGHKQHRIWREKRRASRTEIATRRTRMKG